jgi:hypothetical protein
MLPEVDSIVAASFAAMAFVEEKSTAPRRHMDSLHRMFSLARAPALSVASIMVG